MKEKEKIFTVINNVILSFKKIYHNLGLNNDDLKKKIFYLLQQPSSNG